MDKIRRYEKVISSLSWGFITLLLIEIIIRMQYRINVDNLVKNNCLIGFFIAFLFIFNLFKITFVNSSMPITNKVFDLFRITEVILVSVCMIYFNDVIEYLVLIIPLIYTCLHRGRKIGYSLLILSAITKIGFIVFDNVFRNHLNSGHLLYKCFEILGSYAFILILINISIKIYRDYVKNEEENARLILELGEKYEQLTAAQNEIKDQYDKLKDSNNKLEETNQRLTSSIAEFYTLQQISEAIGSIFDIRELLKFVNDVILGVMGVNYSTIVLFDHNNHTLKVQFTNITNENELAILNENINCKLLLDILENENPIIENLVIPDKYDFIKNRDIGSFMCIPLSSKSKQFGLVLIEHKNYNTFSQENLRLLKTIGKQVSIAIENAGLYEKLQEMATIDGLTGVYNRVYFHQKYDSEYKLAKELGYNFSISILDIDHFKKFNDTYGHLFGDIVLRSVAQTVKSELRPCDTLARFGGEEFVIVFPNTSLEEAYNKVEDLRNKIANNIVKDNVISASVTVSFGVASYPQTSCNEVELIKDADNALYKAKENGRNCVKKAEIL